MIAFFNAMEGALQRAEQQQLSEAFLQVDAALKVLLYDESDEPITLNGQMIRCVDEARKVTELLVALPEFEDTDYLNQVLEDILNAIEAFLQDQIDAESFWGYVIEFAKLVHYLTAAVNYLESNSVKLGQEEQPSLSIALGEGGEIQLYGKISGEDGLSMEKAQELQEQFHQRIGNENCTATELLNLASQLLTTQQFEAAIEAYQEIIQHYPEEAANCYNATGACYYYLNAFEIAIDFYMKALHAGEQEARVAYNVWESCEALIASLTDRNQQMKWKFFFEEHFPNAQEQISKF